MEDKQHRRVAGQDEVTRGKTLRADEQGIAPLVTTAAESS